MAFSFIQVYNTNMIGEPLTTIFLCEYDTNWKKYFEIEKGYLRKYLTCSYVIEHVGSTSVPGMKSRPIVDIIIGVGNEYDLITARDRLAASGYTLDTSKSHLSFYAFYRNIGEKKYFNIYLTLFNSPSWNTHLALRNYLLNHPDKVKEYSRYKSDLLYGVINDMKKYESLKRRYIVSELLPHIQ